MKQIMKQITKTWGKDQSPARSTQKEKGQCTTTGGGKYQPPAGLTQNERFKRARQMCTSERGPSN